MLDSSSASLQLSPILQLASDSPPIVMERLRGRRGGFWVVRDDLLEGGTKQRAILPFLRELQRSGVSEFVYASPFSGYAQVALASACRKLGLTARIYCVEDAATPGRRLPHTFAKKAYDLGAKLILVGNLEDAERGATAYCRENERSLKLPLGFDCERYRGLLSSEISSQYEEIRKQVGTPRSLWLPLGSGTLTRAFNQVLPESVLLNCVNVRVLSDIDYRLREIRLIPRVRFWTASETFEEKAELSPPVPSNIHYDAKLWRFLNEHAQEGDVWWNVGP